MVLGFLPSSLGDGSVSLSLAAATDVIERDVSRPMGIDVRLGAAVVYRLAAEAMGNALRQITVERGLDPRNFRIFSFGGCTALFTATLAEMLHIEEVAVPSNAGVFSAYGLLVAPVARTRAHTWHQLFPVSPSRLLSEFVSIEAALADELRAEGLPEAAIVFKREIDFKFRGQIWELSVELRPQDLLTAESITTRCITAYEDRYGSETASESSGIELVNVRVRAEVPSPPLDLALTDTRDSGEGEIDASRRIFDPYANVERDVRVLSERDASTQHVSGPAIVVGPATTLFVPAGWHAEQTASAITRVRRDPASTESQ
jgi:N-methylhydantoinase A